MTKPSKGDWEMASDLMSQHPNGHPVDRIALALAQAREEGRRESAPLLTLLDQILDGDERALEQVPKPMRDQLARKRESARLDDEAALYGLRREKKMEMTRPVSFSSVADFDPMESIATRMETDDELRDRIRQAQGMAY